MCPPPSLIGLINISAQVRYRHVGGAVHEAELCAARSQAQEAPAGRVGCPPVPPVLRWQPPPLPHTPHQTGAG